MARKQYTEVQELRRRANLFQQMIDRFEELDHAGKREIVERLQMRLRKDGGDAEEKCSAPRVAR